MHGPLVSSSLSASVVLSPPLPASLHLSLSLLSGFSKAQSSTRTLLAVSINNQRSSNSSSSRHGFITMLTESLSSAPARGAGSQDSLLRADGALSLLDPAKMTRGHKHERTCTCTHSWKIVPLVTPESLWCA